MRFLLCILFLPLLFITGCKTDKPENGFIHLPESYPIKITTPYFIRTIEDNCMDAMTDPEHPFTRYVLTARYPDYTGEQFIPLNEAITQYIDEKIADFKDVMMYGAYTKTISTNMISETTLSFEAYHYTPLFASLILCGWEKTPVNPGGFDYYRSFNYDAANRKLLTLRDCLVKESDMEHIAELAASQLNALGIKATEHNIAFATDPNNPENYQFFIIRPKEFIIFFHPCELGILVKKRQFVTIPFSEVEVQPIILEMIGNIL